MNKVNSTGLNLINRITEDKNSEKIRKSQIKTCVFYTTVKKSCLNILPGMNFIATQLVEMQH